MAVDDRKSALVSGIEQAQEALAGLDKEQRRQQQAAFSRLGAGLSFARLTVEGTDTALLTDGLQAELASLLGEITKNPQQAAASPDGFHDRLMRLLAALPVSRGRDLEQEAKGAASSSADRRASTCGASRSRSESFATGSPPRRVRCRVR